jgi:4-diphosphocytidyl-2-C-methyl-D-erythritol kinase
MASAVHIRAHAKLNLALSVGPPIAEGLPDAGFHPIASWIASIDLADDIDYEPTGAGGIVLERAWADDAPRRSSLAWPAEQDLAVRAAHRLSAAAGRELSARIRLTKRIPVGGGLGGGSADAAAVLVAANRAHDLGLSIEELARIGAGLGSDVPYFLDDVSPPGPALVGGLGERIERVPTPATPVVLAIPPFGCDTAEIYRAFDDAPVTLDEPGVAALAGAGPVDPKTLFNDLLPAARRSEPELGELWRTIGRVSKLPVHLSGSGSTMFIVASSDAEAAKLAESLTLHVSGAVFVAASTLNPSA